MFIRRLLTRDPKKRFTAKKALKDPWILTASDKNIKDTINSKLSTKVFQNMVTFKASRKLQAAIWEYIVAYMATEEEKEELIKVFKQIDVDSDGSLTLQELYQAAMLVKGLRSS